MSPEDAKWRSVWIALAALFCLLWVMAQDTTLRDEVWEQWLRVWGALP